VDNYRSEWTFFCYCNRGGGFLNKRPSRVCCSIVYDLAVMIMHLCYTYCCSSSVWAGFQLGDKPLGALEPRSSMEDNSDVAVAQPVTPTCRSVTIKSNVAKTPCILRRRRKKLYGNGKKSMVQHPKSSASKSSASPSVIVSSDCTHVSNTSTDSCITPQKGQSDQILPFSPSQVRFFHFIFLIRNLACCHLWKWCLR